MLVVAVLFSTGCSNPWRWESPPPAARGPASRAGTPPPTYQVRRGDTLYAIAFRHGLDVRDLARWNGLGDGSLIHVGQVLRLYPPGKAPSHQAATRPPASPPPAAAPTGSAPPRWLWPTEGEIVGRYGDSPMTASGVQIAGRSGQPVRASAAGKVVYAGSGLVGYGELLIVRHDDTWLSAYGYNAGLLVGEGDEVAAGQQIARLGEGPGRRPLLHFEIRQGGRPVDPQRMLPARDGASR